MQSEALGVTPEVHRNGSPLLARALKEEQLSCRVQDLNFVLPREPQDPQPPMGQCQGPGAHSCQAHAVCAGLFKAALTGALSVLLSAELSRTVINNHSAAHSS